MTKREEREETIAEWITTVTHDGGIERYDDLHVDQIDLAWRGRHLWLKAGLEAHDIAVHFRDMRKLPFMVVLAFSLRSGETQCGVNFQDSNGLQAELDWSPPSLYLFPPEQNPCAPAETQVPLDGPQLFGISSIRECCYTEFKNSSGSEYSRSVLLIG